MLASLLDKFSNNFPNWRKSCLKNLLVLCLGILDNETVCLYKIKGKVGGYLGNHNTQPTAHYKRLIRIFQDFAFSRLWLDLLLFVFKSLRLKSRYLLLDGTSWKSGKTWHHYLTLCVLYQNVAIPIYWVDLAKKGNSSFLERKKLMNKAGKYFNLTGKILLADREYIGIEWFEYLSDIGLDFVIRLRHKSYKKYVNKAMGKSYEELENKVLRSKIPTKAVKKRIVIAGKTFNFVIMKNPKPDAKEPLLYFLSSLGGTAGQIAAHYPLRWQIEVCFKHLKSNGFNLEALNVAGRSKQKLMLAVVVFAYTLSVLEGLKTYKSVGYKQYADGKVYKAVSVFRHGIDKLIGKCFSFTQFCKYIIKNLLPEKLEYRSPNSIFV